MYIDCDPDDDNVDNKKNKNINPDAIYDFNNINNQDTNDVIPYNDIDIPDGWYCSYCAGYNNVNINLCSNCGIPGIIPLIFNHVVIHSCCDSYEICIYI